ncbi:MAG: hypothetical protein KDA89_05645, partial [Planctomycetaceae bacterium]|nr:hypothetical protein [Planctomycetaceae bacterium]
MMTSGANDTPKFRITRLEDRIVPSAMWWMQEMVWSDELQCHVYPDQPGDDGDDHGSDVGGSSHKGGSSRNGGSSKKGGS